jgi:hypothetical protein
MHVQMRMLTIDGDSKYLVTSARQCISLQTSDYEFLSANGEYLTSMILCRIFYNLIIVFCDKCHMIQPVNIIRGVNVNRSSNKEFLPPAQPLLPASCHHMTDNQINFNSLVCA